MIRSRSCLIDLKRPYNSCEVSITIILFVTSILALIITFRITLTLRIRYQNLILKARISTPIIDLLFLSVVIFRVIITLLSSSKSLRFSNVNYLRVANSFKLLAIAKTKTRSLRIRIVLQTLEVEILFDYLTEVSRDLHVLISTVSQKRIKNTKISR